MAHQIIETDVIILNYKWYVAAYSSSCFCSNRCNYPTKAEGEPRSRPVLGFSGSEANSIN